MHPAWFGSKENIASVASYIGQTPEELIEAFVLSDIRLKAFAWQAVGSYFGWENLDGYPEHYTREEIEARIKGFTDDHD
jgi:hypothetical protein